MVERKAVYGEYGYEARSVVSLRDDVTEGEIQAARASLEASLMPCGPEYAGREIVRLRGLTKMREGEGASMSGAAYVAELSQYPADAVRVSCQRLAGKQTFFPSWAELKAELDRTVYPLKSALDALNGVTRGKTVSVADASREAFERVQKANLDRIKAKHKGAAA